MHHKRDWNKYNRILINRGNLNLWISLQSIENWMALRRKKNGRPFIYADELIKAMCFIRFKLSLREVEGFFRSLIQNMGLAIKVPSYTQLCRRMKTIFLPKHLLDGIVDLVNNAHLRGGYATILQ